MQQSDSINELVKASGNRFSECNVVPSFCNSIHPIKNKNQRSGYSKAQLFFDKVCWGTTECWYWRGFVNHLGYGILGRSRAHRESYELFKGKIPIGLSVLHTCDVRNCVNPDHLFLGTQADNMRDAFAKGRGKAPPPSRGEKNSMSKFTKEIVLSVRRDYDTGKYTQRSLAIKYNMSFMNVSRIVRRKSWSHV